MPKNMFQRPQPINHNRNVPRHGTQQGQLPAKAAKPAEASVKPALPSLEKLLHKGTRH